MGIPDGDLLPFGERDTIVGSERQGNPGCRAHNGHVQGEQGHTSENCEHYDNTNDDLQGGNEAASLFTGRLRRFFGHRTH